MSATLEDARKVLQRYFGYPDFRGGQTAAVAAVLTGRDVLVLMPTGGGKSLHLLTSTGRLYRAD